MILVDTSVWVTHLRQKHAHLEKLLLDGAVVIHPFVIGEIGCGNLRNRNEILTLLSDLPYCKTAEHDEVMSLLESKLLYGCGLGWIDLHLLASTILSRIHFWTLDRRLNEAAETFAVNYKIT
jgi:predicted nucleic acid-binding protein